MTNQIEPKEVIFKIFGWIMILFVTTAFLIAIFEKDEDSPRERLTPAQFNKMDRAYQRGELEQPEADPYSFLPY